MVDRAGKAISNAWHVRLVVTDGLVPYISYVDVVRIWEQ